VGNNTSVAKCDHEILEDRQLSLKDVANS
jgi:hypothetical protein